MFHFWLCEFSRTVHKEIRKERIYDGTHAFDRTTVASVATVRISECVGGKDDVVASALLLYSSKTT